VQPPLLWIKGIKNKFTFNREGGDEHIGTTVVHFTDPARKYDLIDFDFWVDFNN
jgi:hypothetical protein